MDISARPARHMADAFALAWRAPSLGDSALIYARAGVPVFPCVPGGKQPLTGRGFKDATTDLTQISSWWLQRPEANVAIPTGAVSGFDVVDIDLHDGGTGFPAFERARRAGLVSRWAWTVRTPSGGLHVYFPHALGVEQRSWTTAAHVDFRGDGGYLLCPPSRVFIGTQRATYELAVVASREPRPVDAATLRRFLHPPKPIRPSNLAPTANFRPEALPAWVAARPAGTRNDGLFWAACEMGRRGYDHASTLGALGPAALHAGLGEREIRSTVDSAFRRAVPTSDRDSPVRPLAVLGREVGDTPLALIHRWGEGRR